MLHSRLYRNFSLAVAAIGLFALAGCSNQPPSQTANQSPTKSAKASPAPVKKAAAPKVVAVSAKATQQPQLVTVPKGTELTATVGQTLASDKNHPGDSFAASLSSPVTVDGKVVIPKGTHVTGRVVTVKKHEIKVTLASVRIHGKSYDLATNAVRPSEKNQANNKAGGSAASQEKNTDKKEKKDITILSAKTQVTFKLAKPVAVPARG